MFLWWNVMNILICETEAIKNRANLQPFWIIQMIAILEADIHNIQVNRLSKWQYIQHLANMAQRIFTSVPATSTTEVFNKATEIIYLIFICEDNIHSQNIGVVTFKIARLHQ